MALGALPLDGHQNLRHLKKDTMRSFKVFAFSPFSPFSRFRVFAVFAVFAFSFFLCDMARFRVFSFSGRSLIRGLGRFRVFAFSRFSRFRPCFRGDRDTQIVTPVYIQCIYKNDSI